MKDIARLGTMAAVLVAAFAAFSWYYSRSQVQDPGSRTEQLANMDPEVFVRPHSHIIGPPDAIVTVVEFFDPECEACRAVHEPLEELISRYPKRVRLVLRYMPFHQNSVYAAGALEAAGDQARYFEMLETLFANQPAWGNHHAPKPELIPEYARKIGLDMDAFVRFIDSGKHKKIVEIDRKDGEVLGVVGTPTFFVNQKPLPELSLRALEKMIKTELGEK